MMLDHRYQVFFNAVVQGKASPEEARTWFIRLSPDSQREAIRWLCQAGLQASVLDTDVPAAIAKAGIRPTVSAATALLAGHLNVQMSKLLNMKGKDAEHAFRLLLALFALADERRRMERCKNGCSHWWHNLDAEWPAVKKELSQQFH